MTIKQTKEQFVGITYDELLAENAKLRELINILVFCANEERVGCDGCAINDADMRVTVPEWMFCDSLIKRLRELGIEVEQ